MTEQISLIIITYNRPDDLLDLLKSIREQTDLSSLKEILVLNNASTVSYQAVEDFIRQNFSLPVKYTVSSENLGVSRGRNKLMQEASAELLLVLDDDIVLRGKNDLAKIATAFDRPFFKDANTAVITFRVLYYETKQQQQTAFPHKQFNEWKDKPVFLTYYFTGCAHLMKKEVLSKTGLYPEDFFYGMEEYDLSYRIIGEGYTLGYDNMVSFEHKESPKGRQANYKKLSSQWVNKSKVAWKYLPALYYFTTAAGWSIEYIKKAKGNWGTFFSSWVQVIKIPFTIKRKSIGAAALAYLRKVRARLRY